MLSLGVGGSALANVHITFEEVCADMAVSHLSIETEATDACVCDLH